MTEIVRLILAVFTVYRCANLVSLEEGPYLPFLYKSEEQIGIFIWLRIKLGAYDYGENEEAISSIGRGISCPLCVGVYVSFIVSFLFLFPTTIGDFFLLWLGISGAQVFLAKLGN